MSNVERLARYRVIVSVDDLRKVISIFRQNGREPSERKYVFTERRNTRLKLECQNLWFKGRAIVDFTRSWTNGIDLMQ